MEKTIQIEEKVSFDKDVIKNLKGHLQMISHCFNLLDSACSNGAETSELLLFQQMILGLIDVPRDLIQESIGVLSKVSQMNQALCLPQH